jgi:hypothetical protein
MSVTPIVGPNTSIAIGGTSVVAVPANPNGGMITNPLSAADQGLGATEPLYINPTGGAAGLNANGSTFALAAGQTWAIIPGQTSQTLVNAATAGHRFSVVYY